MNAPRHRIVPTRCLQAVSAFRWQKAGLRPLSLGIEIALAAVFLGLAAATLSAGEGRGGTPALDLTVLRENGEAAAGAVVRVMGAEGDKGAQVADAEGHLRVANLQAGEPVFLLAESTDGSEKVFVPVLVVEEGEQRLTITLYPPGRATGELIDDKGRPASDVAVRLSGWERLAEPSFERCTKTDGAGQFEVRELIPGAYYTVTAHRGPEASPTTTWRSAPFTVSGWDGWYNVGILLPQEEELCAPRPAGRTLEEITSGTADEWFDIRSHRWLPAVETFDPNRAWCAAPGGGAWVWRAGRPDHRSERYGAVVEFRRRFRIKRNAKEIIGYLTIAADDYAVVRVNGNWVGHVAEYMRPVNLVIGHDQLWVGENELRLTLRNTAGSGRDYYNPTGLAYSLELIEPTR